MSKKCVFCDKEVIAEQEILVINNIRLLYLRKPVIAASLLIMPVRCVENVHDLTSEEMVAILEIVRILNTVFLSVFGTTGYNLFVNNGVDAGQHVPHVHFHFYGRKAGESLNPFEVLNDPEKYRSRPEMAIDEKLMHMQNIRDGITSLGGE